MGGRRSLRTLLVYVTMVMIMVEVESSLHRVGGGQYTWSSGVNFSAWANHERFYSGDWLFFGFDRTNHSVLQVNKSSYEKCIETDYIFNVTRGGRDVFQLVQPKPYYFICGKGYCLKGMKLAVNVLPEQLSSSPANPFAVASPATPLQPAITLTTVAAIVAATIATLVFQGLIL